MTFIALVCLIGLMYLCGLGPTLLLMGPDESPRRLVVLPVIGLCSYISVAMFLAQFDLTGSQIAPVVIALFSALALVGYRKGTHFTRSELRGAAPAVLLGMFSVAVIGWPLLRTGYGDYWGLANPDAAVLMPLLDWVKSHRLSIPPYYAQDPAGFRGITLNVIFGIYYVTAAVSQATAIPAGLLFTVTLLSLVYLVPGSVYALSEALGLPDTHCIASAALIACSSLVAYTFYLDSLGSFTVIAVMPVVVALALRFVSRSTSLAAIPLVIVCAGIYFGYLANIGFTGMLVGVVLIHGVATSAVPARRAFLLGTGIAVTVLAAFPGFAVNLFKLFLVETFRSRFVTGAPDEIVLGLSSGLTERIFPLYWGLAIPGASAWPFSHFGAPILALGVLLSAFVAAAFWRRVSRLPSVFGAILGAVLAVVIAYVHTNNGYGVFKLAAWAHPFLVVGFVASVFGIFRLLTLRGSRGLAWLPLGALLLYVIPNFAMIVALAPNTLEHTPEAGLSNAPMMSLRETRELASVGAGWKPREISVSVPDAVAQYWIESVLGSAYPVFLPDVTLAVHDSAAWKEAPRLGRYLLRWNTASTDIVAPSTCPAIWSNRLFALSPLDRCKNVLVFGRGWYRFEQSTTPGLRRFRWLRKRGELLLINPASAPQRLDLSLFVGPGNASADRTVSIFLDGEQVDSFRVVGGARVLTKPFVATGPVAQLEVAVGEDAYPLPRHWALWNRWVPDEPRSLNLAVTSVGLAGSDVIQRLPPSVDLTSSGGIQAPAVGFYADRWIGDEARLTLRSAAVPDGVRITGVAPGGVELPFPFHIGIALNGAPLPSCTVPGSGHFDITCAIPLGLQRTLVAGVEVQLLIRAEATFTTPRDRRRLSLRLDKIALSTRMPQ
ncbi:MAG: hypothetical protein ACLPX8_06410 [Bryobacteraceae bacterium]|jgi:hypothetical protein